MKKISNMGLGNLRKQAEPITDNEEEQMWKCGVLGSHNPRLLVNTLIYLNGLHFSLRSGQEHRKLRFKNSQICLLTRIDGTSFLRYKEDVSKTYQGGLKHRKVAPKTVDHYPNSDKNKCHIEIYKKIYGSVSFSGKGRCILSDAP
ncbi:hypothetical protein SNE40_008360 [Patella caerulea]|uniref:ZMYM2-like/QRICH1 C-terminal domain-containing protein n=1 Tax=Patella caerulea TaxID=87958 RepID=A0AAN8JZX9_PATCE